MTIVYTPLHISPWMDITRTHHLPIFTLIFRIVDSESEIRIFILYFSFSVIMREFLSLLNSLNGITQPNIYKLHFTLLFRTQLR